MIQTIETRISKKYLRNKTKDEVIELFMRYMDSFPKDQPLERISEETKPPYHPDCNPHPLAGMVYEIEPLQNGEREDWENRFDYKFCKLDKNGESTEIGFCNEKYLPRKVKDFIRDLLSQSKKEEIKKLIELAERYSKDVSPRCAFLMCDEKSYGYAWKDIIDNLRREIREFN